MCRDLFVTDNWFYSKNVFGPIVCILHGLRAVLGAVGIDGFVQYLSQRSNFTQENKDFCQLVYIMFLLLLLLRLQAEFVLHLQVL